MLVLLEVLGQISDTLAQQSNLDLRRAGVTFMGRVLSDDFLLFFSRQCLGILLILLRGATGPMPARSLSAGEIRQGSIIQEHQTPRIRPTSAGRQTSQQAKQSSQSQKKDKRRPTARQHIQRRLFFNRHQQSHPQHRENGNANTN